MLDDLILALNIVQEGFAFIFNGKFIVKKLRQLLIDDTLLLHHGVGDFRDMLSHLSIVLFAEGEFSLQLESVSRAGLDSFNMLLLCLKLSLQGLHICMMALDFSLEHVLLKGALCNVLLELTVLRDQQLLLAINLLDHLAVL